MHTEDIKQQTPCAVFTRPTLLNALLMPKPEFGEPSVLFYSERALCCVYINSETIQRFEPINRVQVYPGKCPTLGHICFAAKAI